MSIDFYALSDQGIDHFKLATLFITSINMQYYFSNFRNMFVMSKAYGTPK